ncbi:hypothetical protein NQZ68_001871 [Dissostichus eleginoides]|nr:hypothetical protein NQZ68_001871 [Dissostichus eleginoides]
MWFHSEDQLTSGEDTDATLPREQASQDQASLPLISKDIFPLQQRGVEQQQVIGYRWRQHLSGPKALGRGLSFEAGVDDDGSDIDLTRARKRSAGRVKISRETVLQLLVKKGGQNAKGGSGLLCD